MYDGALGKYAGADYAIELKKYMELCNANLFPIPQIHETTLKKEVEGFESIRD